MTNEEKLLDDIHSQIQNTNHYIQHASTDRVLLNKLIDLLVKKGLLTESEISEILKI